MQAPSDLVKGDSVVTGAAFSLYGAEGEEVLKEFTANVTVGDKVSRELVSSEEV